MGKNSIVKDIVEYIEDHLDEDSSLDRIASEMNYSKFYIARVFAKETMTWKRISSYISTVRAVR